MGEAVVSPDGDRIYAIGGLMYSDLILRQGALAAGARK
jgi:hypothetical protein